MKPELKHKAELAGFAQHDLHKSLKSWFNDLCEDSAIEETPLPAIARDKLLKVISMAVEIDKAMDEVVALQNAILEIEELREKVKADR